MSKSASDLMEEVRHMLTAGRNHLSSYESQIIAKIDEALKALSGTEVVDVRFAVQRDDLVALLTKGAPGNGYMELVRPSEIPDMPTSALLSYVLQFALYDSNEGPSLEGSYEILPHKEV